MTATLMLVGLAIVAAVVVVLLMRMDGVHCGWTAVAIFTGGLSLGVASPAWADEALNGTYHLAWSDGDASTWVITSTCSSAYSCGAHVSTTQGSIAGSPGSGDAQLRNGQWTMTIDNSDGVMCRDGTRAPSHNEYSWSASNLSGTLVKSWGAICGDAPGSSTYTFTMTKS
jgi:hypothetical protein